jgi:protein gp37
MKRSKIEWTEVTWNPTTGCNKVSAGCKNCYAEKWANMQNKRGISQYKNGFELTLAPDRLNDPFKWKKPLTVFVNSMSDLFHEKVEDVYIEKIFRIMNDTPHHTFQVLTKRIERVKTLPSSLNWSNNIWLGVSVEHREFVGRIEELKNTPSKIKFISFEPLLSNIEYENFNGIDWVLVGGESGGKARKIEKEWVFQIKNTCQKSRTPFFFKQWGKRIFNPDANDPTINKAHPLFAKGGCMIDNKIHREYPNKYKNGFTNKY